MKKERILACKEELEGHLIHKLLPFWFDRCKDDQYGGFITHFDKDGNDSGEDEKSLIAQTRTVFTMASAHRAGYGDGRCLEYAKHGMDFLLNKMWDHEHGGFFWTVNRNGEVAIDKKILYGLSFAIYSLSEYTLASEDPVGLEYAEKVFDLVQKYAADTMYGGYFEMFERNWDLCGPGSQGGDRKTLDVHMHLMEAFTTLFECSQKSVHRRKLLEDIDILLKRIAHPKYRTGIPQFTPDWQVAPQIKFDIIWGWDRFAEGGAKPNPQDNSSYGHNVEFFWLFLHALDILGLDPQPYKKDCKRMLKNTLEYGIDPKYGGVYVEGAHDGKAYDKQKEFWQQAEVMIGMLEACLRYNPEKYWPAYKNVHRFVIDKMIKETPGEWQPLMTRKGEPLWTHMSHSWKVNYHSVRCHIQCVKRLENLLQPTISKPRPPCPA